MTASKLKGVKEWLTLLSWFVPVAVLFLSGAADSFAAGVKQHGFSSPDEAVTSLVKAVRANDEKGMLAVLGPECRELISSGDEVADRAYRDKFIKDYDQMHRVVVKSANTAILQTGPDNWSMPIPIVKKGAKWVFDTGKGKQEVLNRRIGRNELHVIEVLNAYVDAQHEYATKDCSACGKVVFAQRLISSPGKRDGLYWEAKEGEKESPLGPLVAHAASEGYANADLSPFHGYYLRVLKGQGKHADGGAYSYVVNGSMILGFALVAYPAEYGNSGMMTFIVNQKGDIFQKNLGRKSRQRAEAMRIFDPGKGWKKVEDTAKKK
jgi:hypothetical protein